jgi:hypothetical protein
MLAYDPGDSATFYFVVRDNEDGTRKVRGWTDRKQLAEFYMEFHKCPRYSLKKITKSIEEIHEITEENNVDEIILANIYIKDRDKNNGESKIIVIPATENELQFLNEETQTSFSSRIGYSYLNGVIPYLKKKYISALEDMFLSSLILKEVHNKRDKYNQKIDFDQLMLLFRSFPEEFGM